MTCNQTFWRILEMRCTNKELQMLPYTKNRHKMLRYLSRSVWKRYIRLISWIRYFSYWGKIGESRAFPWKEMAESKVIKIMKCDGRVDKQKQLPLWKYWEPEYIEGRWRAKQPKVTCDKHCMTATISIQQFTARVLMEADESSKGSWIATWRIELVGLRGKGSE